MEKEDILEGLSLIPASKLGQIAEDHEIWEVTEPDVHFKVTRHPLLGKEMYFVAIAGEIKERERIIDEMTEVLGEPLQRSVVPDVAKHIDMVLWPAEQTP